MLAAYITTLYVKLAITSHLLLLQCLVLSKQEMNCVCVEDGVVPGRSVGAAVGGLKGRLG